MAELKPVSPESVADKHWLSPNAFGFAADWGVIPLSLAEVYPISTAMTVGFVKHRASYRPVAITGQQPNQNLYLAPNGQWLGKLLPQALRLHPFQLLFLGSNQFVLSVELASPCIVEPPAGNPFYQQGETAPELQSVLEALQQRESDIRGPLARACQAITDAGLFEPWALEFQREDGSKVNHAGLYRISTEALTALKGPVLEQLHQAQALPLIYAHRFSTYHLHNLDRLAKAHGLGRKPVDLDQLFGEEDDDLAFGG